MSNWFSPYELLLLLFFFIAIGLGWLLAKFQYRSARKSLLVKEELYKPGYPFTYPTVDDRATDIFIKMLETSPETIESNIALGNLFRSKGDLAKAIHTHQTIIAKHDLTKTQRSTALLALAQDFMSAGLLDRAETLFTELYQAGEHKRVCLEFLVELYEKEKDWNRAIETAHQLSQQGGQAIVPNIAHYYCELAEKNLLDAQSEIARQHLHQALQHDKNCARANILLGRLEMQNARYREAILAYQQVNQQQKALISYVLVSLRECYQKLGDIAGFSDFLKYSLKNHRKLSVILELAEQVREKDGSKEALRFMANELRRQPSLRGLYHLIGYYMEAKAVKSKEDVLILRDFIGTLLESKPLYRCQFCGFSGKTLHWQCPNCKKWGATSPTEEQEEPVF